MAGQTVESWLVGLGLDPSGLDPGFAEAMTKVEKFIAQVEASGTELDPQAFTKGLVQGIREGFTELEGTAQVSADKVASILAGIGGGTTAQVSPLAAQLRDVGTAAAEAGQQLNLFEPDPGPLIAEGAAATTLAGLLHQLAGAGVAVGQASATMASGFAGAATQAAVLSAETRNVITGAEKMAAGMQLAGIMAARGGDGLGQIAIGSAAAEVGFGRVQRASFLLLARMAGMPGLVGAVGQGLLATLAPTASSVALPIAGIALIVMALKSITDEMQKVEDESQKMLDALGQQRIGRAPPYVAMTNDLMKAEEQIGKLQDQLKSLNAANNVPILTNSPLINFLLQLGHVNMGVFKLFGDEVERDTALMNKLTVEANALRHEIEIIKPVQSIMPAGVAQALQGLISGNVALASDIKLATDALREFQKVATDPKELPETRALARAMVVGFTDAFKTGVNTALDDLITRFKALPDQLASVDLVRALGLREGMTNVDAMWATLQKLTAEVAKQREHGTVNVDLLQRMLKAREAYYGYENSIFKLIQGELDPLREMYDIQKKQADLAKEQAQFEAQQFAKFLPAKVPTIAPPEADLRKIQAATTFLERQQVELRAAMQTAGGPSEAQKTAVEDATAAFLEMVDAELKAAAASPHDEQAVAIYKALEDAAHRVGIELGLSTEKAKSLRDVIRDFRSLIEAVRALADAFGGLTDSEAKALEGAVQVGEGIARIEAGDLIGGAASLFTGGIQVLSGILGSGNEEAAALRAAQEANTRAVEQLTSAMIAGVGTNATTTLRVMEALRSIDFAKVSGPPGGLHLPGEFINLQEQLAAFGLTADDLQAIAAKYNIEFFKEGGYVTGAAEALGAALQQVAYDLTHFSDSVGGIADQMTLDFKLAGKPIGPLENLEISRAQMEKLFPDQAAWLASLDFTTVQGREEYRKWMQKEQELFKRTSGEIPSLEGGIEDWKQAANLGADALNSFTDATNAANNAMLNVPTGFKLGAERFKALLDQEADARQKAIESGIGVNGPRSAPTGDPTGGARGGLNASISAPAIGTQYNVIQIYQQPGESADVLADKVQRRLEVRSRAQTGDTLGYGRLV